MYEIVPKLYLGGYIEMHRQLGDIGGAVDVPDSGSVSRARSSQHVDRQKSSTGPVPASWPAGSC